MMWVERNRPKAFTVTRRELLQGMSAMGIYTFPAQDYLNSLLPRVAPYYDVVIYGSTIAAINSSYTAALAGAKVALVSPEAYLGGTSGVGGLCTQDMGYGANTIGGVYWIQYQAFAKASGTGEHNPSKGTWPSTFKAFVASTGASNAGYNDVVSSPGDHQPEAKAMRAVLNATALGLLPPNKPVSGITVFMNAPLTTTAGSVYPSVIINPNNPAAPITAIVTAAGTFRGGVFIDATYEGDILASVSRNSGGCSYAIGRESTTAYGESFAGVAPDGGNTLTGTTMTSGYSTAIANPSRTTGAADNAIQVYTYRLALQKVAQGGKAFIKPVDYDASLYTYIADYLTAAGATTISGAYTIYASQGNNKKTSNDASGTLPFAMYNQNTGYPDGTPTQRAAIIAAHRKFYQGLPYFLQTDASVPAAVRTDVALYGIDMSAYGDISVNGYPGWPPQLYIREGRRGCDSLSDAPGGFKGSAGKYQVVKQSDMLNGATQTHPICRTSYIMDCHAPLVYYTSDTGYVADGALFQSGYGSNAFVPMECMIPASGGCPNLIVPVCHGSSHIAWSVMRMEPIFAMAGEAAGFMAAIVAKGQAAGVQNVNYTTQLVPYLNGIGAKIT